jgi:phenylpropionate dioxygenase-like ring-hydroxylating dioxygenase large terminal subunit
MCFGEPAYALDFFPEAAIAGGRRINLAPQTVRSSAPRVVENFLDMAHFSFVHAGILGEETHTEVPDYEVVASAEGLEARQCRYWQPAGMPGQGGLFSVRCGRFAIQTAIHENRHFGSSMRAALHAFPCFRIVGAAETERTLKVFVNAQTHAIRFFRSAVHRECDVTNLRFLGGNGPQDTEERHREREIRE